MLGYQINSRIRIFDVLDSAIVAPWGGSAKMKSGEWEI